MNPTTPKTIAVAIVTALAPLILAFAAFVANEAQILFDMNLDGGALAVYISVFAVAVLAAVIRALEHLAGRWIKDAIAALGGVTQPVVGAQPTAPPAPPAAERQGQA